MSKLTNKTIRKTVEVKLQEQMQELVDIFGLKKVVDMAHKLQQEYIGKLENGEGVGDFENEFDRK